MVIWLVSVECNGVNEAGGVKDVTYALCKGLAHLGHDVTLFTPNFGCTNFNNLTDIKKNRYSSNVFLCGSNHAVNYTTAVFRDFPCKVTLIEHAAFSEKGDVYTYTKCEEVADPRHKAGTGHSDFHFLDCVLSQAVAHYGEFSPSPDVIHCQDASAALTPCYIALIKREDKTAFSKTRSFVTIHNAGPSYHHEFYSTGDAAHNTALPLEWIDAALSQWRVEPFLLSAPFSVLTTVSDEYAKELTDPANTAATDNLSTEFYNRKISIKGITNGVDYDVYNPTDTAISHLPYAFNIEEKDFLGKYKCREVLFKRACDKNTAENDSDSIQNNNDRRGQVDISSGDSKSCCNNSVKVYGKIAISDSDCGSAVAGCDIANRHLGDYTLFIYHGRLATQKGLSVLLDAMGKLLESCATAKLAIIGQGESRIESDIIKFTQSHYGDVVFFNGYDDTLARLAIASGDFIVLPSFFEPCCQLDLIAQLYGTIPIAHATGGLKKIIDGKTGFLYDTNDGDNLLKMLQKAMSLKNKSNEQLHQIQSDCAKYIRKNYSWDAIIKDKYLPLYNTHKE